MEHLDNHNAQESFFVTSVTELQKINKQLAKLVLRKEELTNEIIGSLEHDHEGQKSYEYGVWKIEVKTPVVYSLNKKIYESGDIQLPDNYNPIKQSISYTIDKRLCDQIMKDAPKKVRESLAILIEKKPGKPGITIKDKTS